MWSQNGFTTLTYRDEDLPLNSSLDITEFTKFWKRLRKAVDPKKFRYYACGEYGEQMGRPHYHIIVFGLAPCSCKNHRPDLLCDCESRSAIFKAWGHGGVDRVGSVTYDSARYTADYIHKASVSGEEACFGRSSPFNVMSKGIGLSYILKNYYQLREQKGVTIHGAQVGLPRYYVKKLKLAAGIDYADLPKAPSKVRGIWHGMPLKLVDECILKQPARDQRNLDIIARMSTYKKGRM